jgi:hypothetical protein
LIASRIYVQLGEPENAVRSFERARELRPFLPIFGAKKRPNT